jgi:nucleoid DNA-binding protein
VDITKYIRDYLVDNPSVIVPHLGCFKAVDKSSVQIGNVILPPVRSVEFDNSVGEDDKQLTLYISQKEKCTEEEAQKALDDFYNEITKKLIYKKPVILDLFGILSLDNAGDIVFVPDPNLNIVRNDTFGLKSVNIQPAPPLATTPPVAPPVVISPPVVTPPPAPPVVTPPPAPPVVPPPAPPVVTPPPAPPVVTPPPASPVEPPKSTEPGKPLTADNESLFAGNIRVRENTDRRKPVIPAPVPPQEKKPITPSPRMAPPEKKKTPPSGGSSKSHAGWVVVIVLVIAGLGAGAYWYYTTQIKTALPIADQPTAVQTDSSAIAQGLDRSADAKNALNPEAETNTQPEPSPSETQPSVQPASSSPTVTAPASTPPAAQPKTPRQAQPKTQPAYSQGDIGQGRYIVIVGSFSSRSRAESFAKRVNGTGENCEILAYGEKLIRVGVASYNDLKSATNKMESLRSNRYCNEAWVYGKGKP